MRQLLCHRKIPNDPSGTRRASAEPLSCRLLPPAPAGSPRGVMPRGRTASSAGAGRKAVGIHLRRGCAGQVEPVAVVVASSSLAGKLSRQPELPQVRCFPPLQRLDAGLYCGEGAGDDSPGCESGDKSRAVHGVRENANRAGEPSLGSHRSGASTRLGETKSTNYLRGCRSTPLLLASTHCARARFLEEMAAGGKGPAHAGHATRGQGYENPPIPRLRDRRKNLPCE